MGNVHRLTDISRLINTDARRHREPVRSPTGSQSGSYHKLKRDTHIMSPVSDPIHLAKSQCTCHGSRRVQCCRHEETSLLDMLATDARTHAKIVNNKRHSKWRQSYEMIHTSCLLSQLGLSCQSTLTVTSKATPDPLVMKTIPADQQSAPTRI